MRNRLAYVMQHFICLAILLTSGRVFAKAVNDSGERAKGGIAFTQNLGQWDKDVVFKAEADGIDYFFRVDGVTYLLSRQAGNFEEALGDLRNLRDPVGISQSQTESIPLKASFVGNNPRVEIEGCGKLSYCCNYFYGNMPARWYTNVPNFASITYHDLYPGIDLEYYSTQNGLEYDLRINPGADLSQIKLKYEGAQELGVDADGNLNMTTLFGPFSEKLPLIYQESAIGKQELSGRYVALEQGLLGFKIESDYDHTQPVIIDPQFVYSTYLGGNSYDVNSTLAIDSYGCAYIAGDGMSTDYPNTVPGRPLCGDLPDIIISKFSPEGDSLIYSTFIGGSSGEDTYGVAVDNDGCAYITGLTVSYDFPVVNPYQNDQTEYDAFVVKLSPSGDTLLYSTYLGGMNRDIGFCIATDQNHCAYVAGYTKSTDFPLRNPYQENQPDDDIFLTKFTPEGNDLVYSTYLGGSSIDFALGITVDDLNCAYVTGVTYSSDYPLVNPFMTFTYMEETFVTKVAESGSELEYSTFLGGSNADRGLGITVDRAHCAYITGNTLSTDFPLRNPIMGNMPMQNVYVSKLNPGGFDLLYSTYLGGNREDFGGGIAVDDEGCAYVVGSTHSSDFPLIDSLQSEVRYYDIFFVKLTIDGDSLLCSTVLGGDEGDYGYGVAVDRQGIAYISGFSYSNNFPLYNPYQTNRAYSDMCLTKISGLGRETGADNNGNNLPQDISLRNYPNPFNATTLFSYRLPSDSDIRFAIYDLEGRQVDIVFKGFQQAGSHTLKWQACGLPSGVYFGRLSGRNIDESIKLTLLK
jgi:hypothetical protein